ncbi:MAG: hypothetical protein IJ202_10865 [Bacteroidales bacterium]|nr:hypothetical protein [Bacteroidales bacterium]
MPSPEVSVTLPLTLVDCENPATGIRRARIMTVSRCMNFVPFISVMSHMDREVPVPALVLWVGTR